MEVFSVSYLVCAIFNLLLEFKWKTRADVASVYLEIMNLEDLTSLNLAVSKLVLDGGMGS